MTAPTELSDVSLLRHYVDEHTTDPFGDAFLVDILARSGSVLRAAEEVWGLKAARWARLVTTAEAGASKNLSDLHKQAVAMAGHYKVRADAEDASSATTGTGAPFVVDITR